MSCVAPSGGSENEKGTDISSLCFLSVAKKKNLVYVAANHPSVWLLFCSSSSSAVSVGIFLGRDDAG